MAGPATPQALREWHACGTGRLPDDRVTAAFVDALASQAAADPIPFELDDWRLDVDATRPH